MKRIFTLLLFILGLTLLLAIHASAEAETVTFYNGSTVYMTRYTDESGTITLPSGPSGGNQKFVGWIQKSGNADTLYPAGSTLTLSEGGSMAFEAVKLELKTLTGAAVSVGSPTTLRFDGAVGAADYNRLADLLGAENIKMGILIAPTDSIAGSQSDSKLRLNTNTAGLLARETSSFFYTTDRYGVFSGRTNAIADADLLTSYSARAYVTLDFGDRQVTVYATYTPEDHDRLPHYVIAKSFEDRTTAAAGYHVHACADAKNYYSPYSQSALNALRSNLDKIISVSQLDGGKVLSEYSKTHYGPFVAFNFYTSPYRMDRVLVDNPKGRDTYVIVANSGADTDHISAYFIGHSYRLPNTEWDEWKEDGLYISTANTTGAPF